ncbi:methylated-DNA--[protein]-cysteine S-methyltransferase [Methylophaga thalassica]|uniref:methylated-DNA--[protein]-cysteine S-methyltransferase n=1 Tax=Methylophaga thalassica TaxID=40223 RepID=UPI002E7B0483|nr:methylated-DNA--[protein]-cysteine S-methyltransferase [Methylophaga thalassica]WVI86657.1 methylated-DNA--[protein]-cysteine S-methyltransferase [Methylophaga thalassica]
MVFYELGISSLGCLLVARNNRAICFVALADDPDLLVEHLQEKYPHAKQQQNDTLLTSYLIRILNYIELPKGELDLPIEMEGTTFQKSVWMTLQQVPVGQTRTYTELANMLGKPSAVRAVANACAANSLALLVPCHRIVNKNGTLSGYRWGVERKQILLGREKALLTV